MMRCGGSQPIDCDVLRRVGLVTQARVPLELVQMSAPSLSCPSEILLVAVGTPSYAWIICLLKAANPCPSLIPEPWKVSDGLSDVVMEFL